MAGGADRVPDLAAKVAHLSRPENHPEPTSAVRTIETHMSWVFVADEFVYKMKKPVRLPFLDFSTLALRRHCCEESVRLNRRLALDVYLGVVALRQARDGRLRIGGRGRVVEWLERMRRLPEARMLDAVIARGAATAADVRRCTRVLARFYRHLPPESLPVERFRGRLLATLADNERVAGDPAIGAGGPRLKRIAAAQRRFLGRETPLLQARLAAGRVIEAHGDLRPEHVCLLDEPVFIDCLEFDRDLRVMDVADELSYLAMECEIAGADFVGPVAFATWEAEGNDPVPPRLIAFYKSFRALVRARLAVGHLPDCPLQTHPHWLAQAAGYLELADRYASAL